MKKFKNYFALLLMIMFVGVMNVSAAPITCDAKTEISCTALGTSVCIDNKIPNTVHTIILLIQIAIPVLLVVFGMLDFMKGIMAQKEDEIKKGQQTFIKRLIAAVIVFFVIVIVKLVVNFASGNGSIMECANKFLNGVSEETTDTDADADADTDADADADADV